MTAPAGSATRTWRGSALLGAADQVVSSGTNYATSLVALLTLGAADFGSFVTAFSVITVVAAVQRGFVGEPAMTLIPAVPGPRRRELLSSAVWCALLFGVVCAGLLAWFGGYLLWLAVWLPAILVQDAARYALFSQHRQGDTLVLDCVWALVQGGLLVAVAASGGIDTASVVWTWGAGALAAALVFVVAARRSVRAPSLAWLPASRHLGGWLTGSNVLGQAQLPAVLIALGLIGGAVEVAGFRAVQLLVLPAVQILTAAMIAVFTPRFAALAAAGDLAGVRAMVGRLIRVFGGLGLVVVALAPVAAWVLGAVVPQYAGSAGLIVPISVQAGLFMVNLALDAAVRGMGRVRFQLYLQLVVTVAIVVGVFVGGVLWGVSGSAWAIATCAAAYLCGTALNYRRGRAALSS